MTDGRRLARWFLVISLCIGMKAAVAASGGPSDLYKGLIQEVDNTHLGPVNEAETSCVHTESDFLVLDREILQPWREAWIHKDAERFGQLTGAQWETADISVQPKKPWRTVQGIEEFKQTFDGPVLKREPGLKAIARYLGEFKQIDDIAIETTRATVKSEGNEAFLEARFDLRGITRNDIRRNDRGTLAIKAVKEDGKWKLTSLHTHQLDSVRAAHAMFENVTASSGLGAAPVLLRTEAIRRGGYALATGNLFGSKGAPDMIVGTRDELTLWKNDGKGHFAQVTGLPINKENLVKTAVIADFDNDGRSDILLTKFTPDDKAEDVVLYRNEGNGKFTRLSGPLNNRIRANYAMPAAVADFNKDGLLDFYVGFPGNRDFTFITQASNADQAPKASQGIFLNQGKMTFEDRTKAAMLTERGSVTTNMLYPHSALAYDFNGDHLPDVVVIDDRGNLSPLFKNNGDGTFTQVAESIGVGSHALGMGAAVASMNSDGKLDLVMTSVDFAAASRWAFCMGSDMGPMTGGGLRAFKNMGNGKFSEVTKVAGLEWAGQGAGGAEFIDYNSDGYPDLLVSNGLWSGTSRDETLASYFVRGARSGVNQNLINGLPNPSSRSKFMEVLASSRNEQGERPSMGGYQHKRLFRNNRDGTFTEVGYLAGVDSLADGYVVARADIDGDGKMDIVMRNADPGTEDHKFPVIEIFRNKAESGHGLTLALEGNPEAGSSRDAVSAEVTVKVGGTQQFQTLIMNNGAAQSEKVLHFGLGTHAKADQVDVLWPSGHLQRLRNVPAGRLELQEKPVPTKQIVHARR